MYSQDLADAVTEIRELRAALSDLIESLPKCEKHGRPATRALMRGSDRYCDECGAEDEHHPEVPEYPRAAPLRRAIALLKGGG